MAQILINQFMSARISTQSSQRLSSRFNGTTTYDCFFSTWREFLVEIQARDEVILMHEFYAHNSARCELSMFE
jgi:hypothetical protein